MKKYFLLVFISIVGVASAQKSNPAKEISASLLIYSELMEQGRIDTALGFMYPKFFDVFPRNIIAESMDKAFNDTLMGFSFGKISIQKISKPVKENNIQYVLVDYGMKTKMFYKKPLADNPAQEKSIFELSEDMIKQTYGAENVTGDLATRSFTIQMNNRMIAVNDPKYGNRWWFIEKKDELKTMVIDKVIPATVWNKLSEEKKPKSKKAKKK